MRVLIICTGNTCRSQMAEGFLRHYKPEWEIFSAGTEPGEKVNPYAIEVMKEIGIDISGQKPEHLSKYENKFFDYVITVCDDANEKCPAFFGVLKPSSNPGKDFLLQDKPIDNQGVMHRIHKGFPDPAKPRGSYEEVIKVYRDVRDQIQKFLSELFDF